MTHRRPPPSARRSVRFRAAASPAHRAPPAGNRQTAPWPEAQPPIRRGNRHPTGRPPPGRVRSSRPAQSPLRRSASLRRGLRLLSGSSDPLHGPAGLPTAQTEAPFLHRYRMNMAAARAACPPDPGWPLPQPGKCSLRRKCAKMACCIFVHMPAREIVLSI